MHLDEGALRAYYDNEVRDAERHHIEAHLAVCDECQRQAAELSRRATWVGARLTTLAPSAPPLAATQARARLAAHPKFEKEKQPMWTQPFARQYRGAWSALAMTAVLLLALTLPPVRAFAADFLALFRIQQIKVVEVNPGDLPERMGRVAQFEQLIAEDVQIEPAGGEATEVADAAAATDLAGFSVRLPAAPEGEWRIGVQPGGRVTMNIDLERARLVLKEIGYGHIELPDSLDGSQVVIEVPTAVSASSGACLETEDGPDLASTCVHLAQFPSPTVSAPAELNLEELGTIFMQLMGMSEEEATRFSEQVDWSTTLVVPMPTNNNSRYSEVSVDGVTGTLVEHRLPERGPRYLLLWVRDGIVHVLTGAESEAEALRLANSLE